VAFAEKLIGAPVYLEHVDVCATLGLTRLEIIEKSQSRRTIVY
jgi:hypothetical protein